MTNLLIPIETMQEPDFINDEGFKWWKDKNITDYARREDSFGTTLKATCFIVEEPNGRKTRLLVSEDQQILADEQGLEAMAVKIDMLKFLERT